LEKHAETAYPVHELIAARWSPRAFADRPVEPETLGSLLEAVRWAPSSFNEQPWSLLVARADDREGFERLAACLKDTNAWAKRAPVLMLAVATDAFDATGLPNRHAWHDVGLALGHLALQAEALGLSVHFLAGFDPERARTKLDIPAGHEQVTMFALGYRGDPGSLSEPLRERELAKRRRKELRSFVFGASWGSAFELGA
jgi:nitroreductase